MSRPDSSPSAQAATSPDGAAGTPDRRPLIAFAWLWVGAPLAYGLYELVQKATKLFTG